MEMKVFGAISALLLTAGITFAVHSSAQIQDQNDIIRQLNSDDTEQRIEAFYQIKEKGLARDNKELQTALLNLLDKENRLVDGALRESAQQVGASARYGEGYSEYHAWLAELVMSFADLNDRRTLSILMHSSYHPTSRFIKKMFVSRAEQVVPILIELSHSDLSIRRAEAIETLEFLLTDYRDKISDGTAKAVKQSLTERLSDSDPEIRLQVEHSLQKLQRINR